MYTYSIATRLNFTAYEDPTHSVWTNLRLSQQTKGRVTTVTSSQRLKTTNPGPVTQQPPIYMYKFNSINIT